MYFQPEFRRKAVLLGGLYTTQMLAPAYIMNAMPSILREAGENLDRIGWLYALGMVWSANFLWAPLVDRLGSSRFGHYRGWIMVMQVMLIATLAVISFFPAPGYFNLLIILFALTAIFSSTQDVATDALAVRLFSTEERGIGNTIQVSGNMMGGVLGGGLSLVFYNWLGWQACIISLAACVALPLISLMAFHEPPPIEPRNKKAMGFGTLARFFLRPGILHWICILLALRAVGMAAYGMLSPLLVDIGWTLEQIGVAMYLAGPLIGLIGAGAAGWLITRFGRKFTVQLGMVFTIMTVLGMLFPANGYTDKLVAYCSIGLLNCGHGFTSTVLYTIIMDKCDPASAGTDFSLQMALTNGAMFVAVGIALHVAERIGYSDVLIGCAVLGVAFMTLIQAYQGFEGEEESHVSAATQPE